MSDDKLHSLAPRWEVTRRDALKLFAAGIAAFEASCMTAAGDEEIVPYVVDPPEHRPGTPVRYASTLALDGFGTGVIVETREGRPIKLDGNPAHPASLGGSSPILQAQILELYDPQRSRDTLVGGALSTWHQVAARLDASDGPLWFVMPPLSSPTLRGLLARLANRRELHVVYDAPCDHGAAYRGHALVFGAPLEHQPDLARADVIVALDSDFMGCGPMAPAWARAAATRRMPTAWMSRLWVCEPMPTPTGTLADERLAIPARDVVALATCVLDRLRARGLPAPALERTLVDAATRTLGMHAVWAVSLADDLVAHRGAVAVMVGDRQPPIVHALARWIEHACGTPIACSEPVIDPTGETVDDLSAAAMTAAAVIVIDADPIYTSPHHAVLADALASVFSVHVGLHRNATSRACAAHVPLAHELEAWSDARAYDGTLAIGQPAIRPRFEVVSPIELVARLLGDHRDARTLVQDQFRTRGDADHVIAAWTEALRAGVVAGTRAPQTPATPTWPTAATGQLAHALVSTGPFEIALASSQLHDGRFAPNAWLQELPHPITKQTWGNAALMSAGTAATLGVDDETLVTVIAAGGEVTLPALVVAGASDGSITIELGYGQIVPETPIADRVGSDAYGLRSEPGMLLGGLAVRARGKRRLARTQHTMTQEDRDIAPTATLARYLARPDVTDSLRGEQVSLLPARSHDGVQWGMSIDTTICTGCSACMVACQAENNIPVVGAEDVARGRHMNWIRIDRYIVDGGAVVNEPMTCQHCENAPCEYVCPVMATEHSPDGLNEQVYNRCVGTRFCSNNCPYKVRRFNWFAYEQSNDRALQYNPDVTVRSRGVMEKCTYCVQRIRRAEHAALVEHRAIRTGEVVTACMQACPTGAIQFGELHEQGTQFARMRRDPRRFEALFDLGTRPRTQDLAKIRNPRQS